MLIVIKCGCDSGMGGDNDSNQFICVDFSSTTDDEKSTQMKWSKCIVEKC